MRSVIAIGGSRTGLPRLKTSKPGRLRHKIWRSRKHSSLHLLCAEGPCRLIGRHILMGLAARPWTPTHTTTVITIMVAIEPVPQFCREVIDGCGFAFAPIRESATCIFCHRHAPTSGAPARRTRRATCATGIWERSMCSNPNLLL
jgi:hypothetical protein